MTNYYIVSLIKLKFHYTIQRVQENSQDNKVIDLREIFA